MDCFLSWLCFSWHSPVRKIKERSGTSTFNGPTVINAGTLVLNAGGGPAPSGTASVTANAGTPAAGAASGLALGGTASVTINAGGTVTLGAANQINPAATLILNANSGTAAGATVAFTAIFKKNEGW